ncbi:hypothetical protein D3C72_1556280 [compost metagenome]
MASQHQVSLRLLNVDHAFFELFRRVDVQDVRIGNCYTEFRELTFQTDRLTSFVQNLLGHNNGRGFTAEFALISTVLCDGSTSRNTGVLNLFFYTLNHISAFRDLVLEALTEASGTTAVVVIRSHQLCSRLQRGFHYRDNTLKNKVVRGTVGTSQLQELFAVRQSHTNVRIYVRSHTTQKGDRECGNQ